MKQVVTIPTSEMVNAAEKLAGATCASEWAGAELAAEENGEIRLPFSVFLDVLDVPIHIIDRSGLIRYVNPAWEVFMHDKKTEVLGHHINEVLRKSSYGFFFSIEESDGSRSVTHFDQKTYDSVAIATLEQGRPVSMFTYSTSNNKLIVTSVPIYREGKITYVLTSCTDITEFSDTRDRLEDAIQQNKLISDELKLYRTQYASSSIVGNSKVIGDLREMVSYVASTSATVLITGESGVGKEVVTKEIYNQSKRNSRPFIKVNCASIPENLMESELFGYEKGAFTGASKHGKIGLFELANTGTLLLDEIGELPKALQPKLLRVLQEREIMRVGGTAGIPVDVRLIAATNQNLEAMVQAGSFRKDLYYRLNIIPIRIPPLREHKEDIPLLAQHFLSQFNNEHGKNKKLTQGALSLMTEYNWPGNIREMENLLERLIIIGDESFITTTQIERILLGEDRRTVPTDGMSLREIMNDFEKAVLKNALETYGTTYKAAEALCSSQATIARKAKEYGLKWH
ncbi:sigma-54 interaction domain-containing protein [Papillibacter cinnamivorans]|uniref:HTH-type transcriptional regulatory protein TyrR n=1 Tax=Papillibacter cinnamivorans DSM 12816 TaxID=1122930 RepID=A0A1W2A1B4_9FIRM|nr:sigma 54-interacting transcriptional regulator [Papillibacter cinnamivorans]SMC54211.1 TyrR family helix-turn-helix domain-containing protein [Papillibacter cinnamivorans DSM 12816]